MRKYGRDDGRRAAKRGNLYPLRRDAVKVDKNPPPQAFFHMKRFIRR